MFATTKDILFFVLSFCLVFATFFFCYLMFYVVRIVKRVDHLMTSIEDKMNRLHAALENGFSYLNVISDGVKMLLGYMAERKGSKKTKR